MKLKKESNDIIVMIIKVGMYVNKSEDPFL